jgi:hypothetical protein
MQHPPVAEDQATDAAGMTAIPLDVPVVGKPGGS